MQTGIRALLGSILLVLPGCGAVAHGRLQKFTVATTPPGAQISIAGVGRGVSPAVFYVPRKQTGQVITITAPGYETEEIVLKRRLSKWLAADLLWGASQLVNQGVASSRTRRNAAVGVTAVTLGVDFLAGGAFTQKRNSKAPVIVLRPVTPQ